MSEIKTPAEMRKLAEAATPGPRALVEGRLVGSGGQPFIVYAYAERPVCGRAGDYYECHNQAPPIARVRIKENDQPFIAAANPSQIIHDANLIEAQARRIEELTEVIVRILRCDFDAERGLVDCCDNGGQFYSSAELTSAVADAHTLLRALLSPTGAS